MGRSRSMRILYVSPYYDDRLANPEQSLDRFPILRELPQAMAARGHQVRVLSLGPRNGITERDSVRYRWISPGPPTWWFGRLAHRIQPHYGPAYYQPSLALARCVHSLAPDITHIFGLTMDLQLALINMIAGSRTRTVVHYHGGIPPSGRLRSRIQRLAIRDIAVALFTTLDQADDWIAAGMLAPAQVDQLLETSSPFRGIPRDEARRITGMTGNPVYLSVGRLHPIKDPMTLLGGFAEIARRQPDARLYLYYLTDELLDQMMTLVRSLPDLRDRVEFRGRATPDQMEAIYSSADILLQASVREWSGLAILEAMSCGCVPVVSDIPSFSTMTGGGTFGRLFPAGDRRALADAAMSIADLAEMSAAVRTHFERELSFAAMASKLERIYSGIVEPA
ncbi:MAG: glycosyltransferase family 4 protein [Thermomicrobiales bacterium]